MEKNNNKKQNVYISEEENVLKWEEVQAYLKRTFGQRFIQVGCKRFL